MGNEYEYTYDSTINDKPPCFGTDAEGRKMYPIESEMYFVSHNIPYLVEDGFIVLE